MWNKIKSFFTRKSIEASVAVQHTTENVVEGAKKKGIDGLVIVIGLVVLAMILIWVFVNKVQEPMDEGMTAIESKLDTLNSRLNGVSATLGSTH